jgi:hypothetical protein
MPRSGISAAAGLAAADGDAGRSTRAAIGNPGVDGAPPDARAGSARNDGYRFRADRFVSTGHGRAGH